MQKIKNILNANTTYVILVIFIVIHLGVSLNIDRTSVYSLDDDEFVGTVERRVTSNNKISFTIDAEEKLICNYYSDDEDEKEKLLNEVILGSKVKILGTLKEPINNTVPNTFNYKEYLYNRGVFYTCIVGSIEVEAKSANPFYIIKNAIEKRIMSFHIKDYLYTMIIGDKSLLDEETYAKYQSNGVTHLFAISGMHVGLFAAIIAKLLKRCKVRETRSALYVAAFIWFYAFLAGFGASVVRATLLFTYIAIDKAANLQVSKVKILFLVGATLVFANFRIIFDLGFIYSFVTTFGLIWTSKLIEKHKIMGTSLVANLYSLPITINNFYKFNLASILYNIIFVPFVSAVIYPLCLATFFLRFLEPVTAFMIGILEFLNNSCAELNFFVFVVPAMNVSVLGIYYLILLTVGKKRLYKVAVILFAIILLNKVKPVLDVNAHVEFMDVGQGDSIIIRSSRSREVVMIDTGGLVGQTSSTYNVSDNVITYLNSLGIDRIDYLFLTHGDADHLGDAMNVLTKMNVKNVILNRGEHTTKEKEILASSAHVIDEYDGMLDLRSLNDKDWKDENDNSIVLHLKIEGVEFLFMGDASKEVEKYIIGKNQIQADVVKLGHHGSKTSSDDGFLKSLRVKTGIISSGRNNRYNHPSPETIDTLNKLGIDYYDTQTSGSVSMKVTNGRVTTSVCPP